MKYKLKSFTLIESIVALIIIMLCFGIGLMIYVNVMKSDSNFLKLKSSALLKEIVINTKINKHFIDEQYSFKEININKRIEKYKDQDNLNIVIFEAYDKSGKKICEMKELVIEY